MKEGFSAYSSPVMQISRKVTEDKRVVTDFRHLNMRIAKNNLAYPLLKDTFMLLGGSKCEVLSVLDLKDAFHSLRLKLIDLLQALCINGLKISPKKCQLFKTELQYMGNTIFIKEKRVCVKPLRSRQEAIHRLKPTTNQNGCRSFAGVVNFVSIFCPELQKLLKPIYELTQKGRPFVWEDEQQKVFDEIKSRLLKLPVLSMPDKRGRFLLYSDTSKYATGSALHQVQSGKPKLIVYMIKGMPEAAGNYSITELEMCSLAINIASFAHLLKRVGFLCHCRSFGNHTHNEG